MPRRQHRQGPVDVARRQHGHHADAHVERLLHLGAVDAAPRGDQPEDRRRRPGAPLDHGLQAGGQHPLQVAGQPAAGDVGEGAHVGLGGDRQAVAGVDPGGHHNIIKNTVAELLDVAGQRHPADLEQHVPGEGVAVGVQAGRGHGHEDVAGADPLGPQQCVGVDDPDARGRQVVAAVLHQAGVLGGLPAQQRAAGLPAALGDPRDDRGDLVGHHLADGDVVLQEQRLGAADDQVVDDHRDEVEPDRVVLAHGLGDGDLRADTVGGRGEYRLPVAREPRGEEAREPADAAEHLGAVRLLGVRAQRLDRPFPGLHVHTGGGVAGARVLRRPIGPHGVTAGPGRRPPPNLLPRGWPRGPGHRTPRRTRRRPG